MPESSFQIEYSREAIDHLRYLSAARRGVLFDAVDTQLTAEPLVETRNRKLMRPNQLAVWELRVGDLRVYYDVELEPERIVVIRAVGIKERHLVRIGGEEVQL